ncbi:hypothetical protein ABZY36_35300 [Streptomyces sp. NPDC006627]|uniref:hypothetical protein n=1 Tax=Streptomyces sp. NPDC006627 TaxID=3154679 RepID=UPI0033AAD00A
MATGGVLVGRGYVSIRPEFEGDWNRTVSRQGAAAGELFAGAFGKVLKTAAIPIAAVGVATGAALASSFAAAGAGAGAFKAAVKPQLEEVTKASELYTKAQEAAAEGGEKAAAAQKAYKDALKQMTPATRATAKSFVGLKDDYKQWSDALSSTTMPLFTRGIELLRGLLPKLTPLVKSAAGAFKGFLDDLGKGQAGKVFGEFADNMQAMSGGALTSFLNVAKNIAVGFVGILNAFAPMSQGLTGGMEQLSARFAEFGANLGESSGFASFMTYVRENGPVVVNLISSLATTAGHLLVALAPLGGSVLLLVDGFASLVAAIPTPVLSVLATTVATLVVAFKAYALAVLVIEGVTAAWATVQAILNGTLAVSPIGIVVAAVVALGAAFYLAYRKSETFRAIVAGVWQGIQTAASFAWNSVIMPALGGFVAGLRDVGAAASWLWTTILQPAFAGIALIAKILATVLVVAVVAPIVIAIKALGAIGKWLWEVAIGPAFRGIAALGVWLWNTMLKPAFDAAKVGFRALGAVATWLWRNAIAPAFNGAVLAGRLLLAGLRQAFSTIRTYILGPLGSAFTWLWNKAVKPVFSGIKSTISTVWNSGIKPVFNTLKTATGKVADAFRTAKDGIKKAWDKVKGIAKGPVNFIVDVVYNKGIVGVWNKVAGAFGAPKLDKFQFARGGILPGYTPGRDPHHFYSPTGGQLEMSGGEAIMRPEFTRAVGAGFVGTMNRIARSRGARGVKAALAPVFGGNPPMPTDRSLRYARGGVHQAFADGGIFGWIGKGANAVAGAGSAAWNKIKEGAAWLKDTLEASARAGVEHVVDPILKSFPGMDTGIGKMLRRIPTKIIDALFGYTKEADKKGGGGGVGGPRIKKALNWAKTQHGKPYQWAGNGNPSWDCSGFLSAIESVIRGQKPHRRWATMAFSGKQAPPGWVYHGNSAFRVGITNAGVGHTAGTLGKTNVESRGGDGVLVGKRARAYSSSMFGHSWYGFMPGKYDQGGWLGPGQLGVNQLRQPEAVLTPSQWRTMTSVAAQGAAVGDLHVSVYVGDREITDIARTEVRTAQGELIGMLNAG